MPDTITVRFPWGARAELNGTNTSDMLLRADDDSLVCAIYRIGENCWLVHRSNMDAPTSCLWQAGDVENAGDWCANPDKALADLPSEHWRSLATAYPPDCETMAEILREEGLADLSVTNGDGHTQLYEPQTRLVLVRFHDNEWTLPNSTFLDESHKPHEVLQSAREYLTSLPPDEQAKWRGEDKAQKPPRFAVGQELTTREQCVAALRDGWRLQWSGWGDNRAAWLGLTKRHSSRIQYGDGTSQPLDNWFPNEQRLIYTIVGRQPWAETEQVDRLLCRHCSDTASVNCSNLDCDCYLCCDCAGYDGLCPSCEAAADSPPADPPDSIEVEWGGETKTLGKCLGQETYKHGRLPFELHKLAAGEWEARVTRVVNDNHRTPQQAVTALEERLMEAVGPVVELSDTPKDSTDLAPTQIPDVLLAAVWICQALNASYQGKSLGISERAGDSAVTAVRQNAETFVAGLRAAGLGGVL